MIHTFKQKHSKTKQYFFSLLVISSFIACLVTGTGKSILDKGLIQETYAITTIGHDTFQRANQTHWGTASDGQAWGSDASTNSIFSINTNTGQVVGNGTGSTFTGVLGPTVTDAQELFIGYMASTYQDSNFGPILRWQDNNNFYKAYLGSADNPSFGSCYHTTGTYFLLLKKVAGTYTIFSCPAFTASPGTSYSIRFQVVGQVLSARVWTGSEPGSWMVSATDAQFASGRGGIRSVNNNGAVTHVTSFDLFDLTPDCTTGASSCSACSAPANTCSNGNGTQTCTHDQTQTCNPVVFTRSCTLNNCNGGYTCTGGVCVLNNCTTGTTNCGVCTATTPNTCSTGNGTQTCYHNAPAPCTQTPFTNTCTISACNGGYLCSGGTCIPSLYTISGTVFNDANGDGLYQKPTEAAYAGSGQQIHVVGGSINQFFTVSATNGTYTTGQILPIGTYTVSYTGGPPSGYFMTEPVSGPPPSFTITVGVPCTSSSTGTSKNAVCSNGNITDIDYGITNTKPWYQSFCGDMRIDAGISDNIPASPICGSVSGAYAIQTNASVCPASPGIAFTGATDASFNQGQSSVNNWLVGGSVFPETFKPVLSKVIRSSYEYMMAPVKQSGITTTDLISSGICSNAAVPVCDFSTKTLTHGIYTANRAIVLTAANYTFPAAQNFVFLITGGITIRGQIHVPVSSTAIFSASGDITVDPSVGESSSSSTVSDIEGLYSTDGSFNTPGISSCSTGIADKRLNLAGSIIVNAGYQSPAGTFQQTRDLCTTNAQCPAVTFTQRPDFILNSPSFIKNKHHVFREVAP